MTPQEYVQWYCKKFNLTYNFPTQIKDYESLITLIEKFNIKSIFEIGTWQGDASLLLWLHPNVEKLKTIDINSGMDIKYNHWMHTLDNSDTYGSMIKNTNIDFKFVNSKTYNPEGEQFDMVFIDGNHVYDYIESDTLLAFKFHPKIIVWHDYGAGNLGVVEYVNMLKQYGYEIKGFEDSLIVFYEVKNGKS